MNLQCKKKLEDIFRAELEKKKKQQGMTNDLMDGLMQMKDDDGDNLSDQEVIDNIISLVIGGFESLLLYYKCGLCIVLPSILKSSKSYRYIWPFKIHKQGMLFYT